MEITGVLASSPIGSRTETRTHIPLTRFRGANTTPTALADRLQGIDVERVYLTHLFPETEAEADALRDTVAARVDAEVRVASDRETVVIE